MKQAPHILIVDDDQEIRTLTARFLRGHGYRVDVARDGAEMQRILAGTQIDLILLDRVLPDKDGITLCQELRAKTRIPIVLVTLLGDETDRIVGLEVGADDYIAKPFNPHELLARIKAVLRRTNALPPQVDLQRSQALRFAGWCLDPARRRLANPQGVVITLTDGEFDLLIALAERSRVVLSREQLLSIVSGRTAVPFDRSVDMQIARLRRRIEEDPEQPELIKTIRHKGYLFTPEVTRDNS